MLRHYVEAGAFSAERLIPVVAEIGEALVLKLAFDSGTPPSEATLADIADQAIPLARGLPTP
ncbi:hypothetical protein [Nonomuraea longicatena]|uniref:hypothetical protein n=1 Tax=Nonomuraea longicatena TaxID=83682 RepID=UPI0031CE72C7